VNQDPSLISRLCACVALVEAVPEPRPLLERLRGLGVGVGLTLNPDTSLELVYPHLGAIDLILIMSVFPGFGGQKYIPASTGRIRAVRERIDAGGHPCLIEVDGGINRETCREAVDAGADVLVAGSAIFGSADYADTIRALRGD